MKRNNLWVVPVLLISLLVLIGFGVTLYNNRNRDPYTTQSLPELPVPPIKELAERKGIQVGSFASLKYLRERPYSEILATEFEYAIIDGEPNWKFEDFSLRPSKDTFDFRNIDTVFNFTDENDMPVRVQHLLWGDDKWLPDWLMQGNYTQQELLDIIKNHIETIGSKYKGKVREYSVVNEAFSRKLETGGNKDWWGIRLGTEYIDKAFVWARNADPSAILILNDFGNETVGEISNLMYEYVKDAKTRGIPIDAIGMQMHISGSDSPQKSKVKENMQRFASLGLKVYITEFDVNMHFVEGSEKEKDELQARIYGEMLEACLEVGPSVCPNFGFLGLIDRQSWYNGIGLNDANPLLFRDDYTPKPAFFTIRDVLQK